MNWVQMKLKNFFDKDYLICFKAILEEQGAIAVAFENSLGEFLYDINSLVSTAEKLQVIALFDNDHIALKVKNALATIFQITGEIEGLANQNWKQSVIAKFTPLIFANKICIHPSWKIPEDDKLLSICINSGIAFGTGKHTTTSLCINWLINMATKLKDSYVIDYGCGSGVLGMVAAKLGANKVIATDIEPQALIETRANATSSNISEEKLFTYLPNEIPNKQADIVLANLNSARGLINIKNKLSELTQVGGTILLSGFEVRDIKNIIDNFTSNFTISEQIVKRNWALLVGIRKV